jgi:hypothetical protein
MNYQVSGIFLLLVVITGMVAGESGFFLENWACFSNPFSFLKPLTSRFWWISTTAWMTGGH